MLTVAHSSGYTFYFIQELGHESIANLVLDDEPSSGDTCLPRGDEGRERCAVYSRLDVRVVKYDDWSLRDGVQESSSVYAENIECDTLPPSSAVNVARFDPTMLPRALPVAVPA